MGPASFPTRRSTSAHANHELSKPGPVLTGLFLGLAGSGPSAQRPLKGWSHREGQAPTFPPASALRARVSHFIFWRKSAPPAALAARHWRAPCVTSSGAGGGLVLPGIASDRHLARFLPSLARPAPAAPGILCQRCGPISALLGFSRAVHIRRTPKVTSARPRSPQPGFLFALPTVRISTVLRTVDF